MCYELILLQRNDYCLVECTAKKDMDKSNKYQWHVVCTRTEEGSYGEIEVSRSVTVRVRMVRLSVMVGRNISALNILCLYLANSC